MNFNRANINDPIIGEEHVYIPRVNRNRATFQFIATVFAELRIGFVEYVDFIDVSIHTDTTEEFDPEEPFIKNPLFVSAFIKVSFWDRKILDSLKKSPKLYKLYLYRDSDEHWLLLPNKTPVERTILNIHQIAAHNVESKNAIALVEEKMRELEVKMTKQLTRVIQENSYLMQTVERLNMQNAKMAHELLTITMIASQTDNVMPTLGAIYRSNTPVVENQVVDETRKKISETICGNA